MRGIYLWDVDVWRSCFPRSFSHIVLPLYCLSLSRSSLFYIRDSPASAQQLLRLGAQDVTLMDWWRTTLTYFLPKHTLLSWHVVHTRVVLKAILLTGRRTFCFCDWIAPWSGSGLPMETILDPSWRLVSDGLLEGVDTHGWWLLKEPRRAVHCFFSYDGTGIEYKVRTKQKDVKKHLRHREHDTPTWKLSGTQGAASFWERTEASLPPPRPKCNFRHPKQLNPFPERLELPFPIEEILSGYEDIVSPGTDQFTTFVKTDPDATSVRHMVDVWKASAEFREASEKRHDTSSQAYRFEKLPNRSPVQKRLSIYNWNPGPRRGKEDAFEKKIVGMWHVITLKEVCDYVDHELLTNRFHVTHHAGCLVLFNMDTFYANVDVKSICLPDTRRDLPDQVMEGDQGRVMQGVLSHAPFRRSPLSGQKTYGVVSTYKQYLRTKKEYCKKLILTIRAIVIGQQTDLVASDFNGTAWQCSNRDNISTVDEAFADCALLTPTGPYTTGDPVRFQTTGLTSVDSLSHWVQVGSGRHACMVPSPVHAKLSAAIMRHGSTWISSIGATSQSHHEVFYRRIFLKERPTPYQYGQQKRCIGDIMSDHSLYSWPCDHSHAFVNPMRSLYILTKWLDDVSHSVAGMLQERHVLVPTSLFVLHSCLRWTFTLRNTPHEHHVMAQNQEQVDMVAGDSMVRNDIEECVCQHEGFQCPRVPHSILGSRRGSRRMIRCVRFIKSPGSETKWHIRMHGAFEIPHAILGIKPTDQSCHHEVWIHLLHINARLVDRASRHGPQRRPIISRKTNSPFDHK